MKEVETEALSALARSIIEITGRLREAEKAYKTAIAPDTKALEEAEQALKDYLTEQGMAAVDVAPFTELPQQLWRIEKRSSKVRFFDPAAVYRALGTEGFQLMKVSAPAVDELQGKLPEDKWQQIHEGYQEKESEPWIAITLKRKPRER